MVPRSCPHNVAAAGFTRRHDTCAFSCATTSGPGVGLFTCPSTLPKSEQERSTRRGGEAEESAALMTSSQEQPRHEQKSSGRCPSPRHCGAAQVARPWAWAWARLGPPFVLHAEERYTWVSELAGVRVGETTGGVPLLWRGCGPGCLDFLNEGKPAVALGGTEKGEKD